MNQLVCFAYTDLVVKLSATLVDIAQNNLVSNVHGVRSEFLAIGAACAKFPQVRPFGARLPRALPL